jgi:predicted amidohydrolase/ribosomal protein S18 acetylase RimI-like enzyme
MEKPNTKTRVSSDRRLEIRNATLADLGPIRELYCRVYPGEKPYSAAQLRGQIHGFPEGQFVATYDGRVVGYCATFRISGAVALKAHTWKEITGSGFASRHDPEGEYLYGMEIFVDPDLRGYRIGQRLYDARKWLCKELELAGILFAGRIPSWRRRSRQFDSIEDYIEAVRSKKKRDSVLSFQMRNGFEVLGVIKDYLPSDIDSLGYAVHMIWRNPSISPEEVRSPQKKYGERLPDTVRVATVQYMQRRVNSFDEFLGFIEYFVDVVADYRADFVVFPELFSLQLLSITDQRLTPADAIEALTKYNEPFKVALREMAIRYNINIIGGSHPVRMGEGDVRNISCVFHRDGHISQQEKIHPTPNESYWWNIEGGSEVVAIQTDCGPIGVLICYDAEFPELARHLVDQGANILFVPFCTDERQSYLRVRYCCQARAVENQCYVVMSGNCGNLPGVANMDIQYAQSCILTPCDFPFARDGIAADTTPNVETVAFADLRLESLMMARNSGTVQNLKDRRHDLYGVEWRYKS